MIKSIFAEPGYSTSLKLSKNDLNILLNLVRNQYLKNIYDFNPNLLEIFKNDDIKNYHLHSHLIDHNRIWSKKNRTLSLADLNIIKKLDFYSNLNKYFGDFTITDEDNIGHGEIYWRLVRPDVSSDVGDLHADFMFWEYRKDQIPLDTKRIKIWIGLITEPGLNGFIFIPNSHLKKIVYTSEIINNRIFFKIQNLKDFSEPVLFNSGPGEAIIFNDNLIHGGKSGGIHTRISIEFTMLVKNIKD